MLPNDDADDMVMEDQLLLPTAVGGGKFDCTVWVTPPDTGDCSCCCDGGMVDPNVGAGVVAVFVVLVASIPLTSFFLYM